MALCGLRVAVALLSFSFAKSVEGQGHSTARVLLSGRVLAQDGRGTRRLQGKGCSGRFECSSMEGSRAGGACEFGHTAVSGGCDIPCDGVRRDPCKCETKEEAQEGNKSDALSSLGIAGALTAASVLFGIYAFRKRALFAKKAYEMQNAEAGETPSSVDPSINPTPPVTAVIVGSTGPPMVQGVVVGAAQGSTGNSNTVREQNPNLQDYAPPTTQTHSSAIVHDVSRQSNDASLQRAPSSRFELASERSATIAEQNPHKFMLFRGVVPFVFIGFAFYLVVSSFTKTDAWYDKFETFMQVVACAAIVISVLGTALFRCVKVGLRSGDDPLRFIVGTSANTVFSIPIVGGIGMIWAVAKYNSPGTTYHAHCGEWDHRP